MDFFLLLYGEFDREELLDGFDVGGQVGGKLVRCIAAGLGKGHIDQELVG